MPRSVGELSGHTILLGTASFGESPAFQWLRSVAAGACIGYPASNASAHVASVRVGAGIGIVPLRLFGDDPDLIVCFDVPETYNVETWLVAPEALRDDPAVRALLNFIGAYRGATPAAFAVGRPGKKKSRPA